MCLLPYFDIAFLSESVFRIIRNLCLSLFHLTAGVRQIHWKLRSICCISYMAFSGYRTLFTFYILNSFLKPG